MNESGPTQRRHAFKYVCSLYLFKHHFRLMKVLILFSCLLAISGIKAQDRLLDYFTIIESDSFHIKPFNYFELGPQPINDFRDFKGKLIPKGFEQLESFDSLFHPVHFYANEAIKVDSLNYACVIVVQTKLIYD